MFLELDTSDAHLENELSLMSSVDALEFPRNSTDTQPPPATALRDLTLCGYAAGTAATAEFSVMVQPVTLTFVTSKAATAPPHVEHGSLDWLSAGHPISPPMAVLLLKVLFCTRRDNPASGPVADIAPPLAALQFTKLHCDTATLLPTADTAPPLPLGLEQCWNVTPVKATVELLMLKAGPLVGPSRRLQSKKVEEGTPLMTIDETLSMLTVDSLNTPALRFT
jgi:hypothetical protein